MANPKGYSTVQIALHWAVAALILFQFLNSDAMSTAWGAVERGGAAVTSPMVWVHIIAGIAVLAFAVWRLVLRFRRGVPDAVPASRAMTLAAELGHWGLYALMLALPLSGMAAWFGGVVAAGEAHQLAKMALIVLVAGHVLAALYHQFIRKDRLLVRMARPQD